jgi:twitching motility protein PilT
VTAGPEVWHVAIEPQAAPAPEAVSPPPEPPPEPASGHSYAGVGADNSIESLLLRMLEMGASDLHLSTGSPPHVRIHGAMQGLPGLAPFEPGVLLDRLYEVTPARNREEFERRHDTDFAIAIPGVSRFRANLFRDRHGPGAVFRAIPFEIRTPEELGLPKSVLSLCDRTKGLILVTGPTGSGKSTTLATLIDHVNRTRTDHIITIEDPIEFVHENKKCLVNQREVHSHTDSFKEALRAALREDPDIVLVGEMRDLETIAIAVETAETGHLVFGTLHTTTAASTIDRIIDQFPADRQDQIRQMLAGSLAGVVAQMLCRRIGGGRVAAYEILIGGSAVSNLIREKKTFQIYSVMQTGKALGMVTLNDSLLTLVRNGAIEAAEAFRLSVNKSEMAGLLSREGHAVKAES